MQNERPNILLIHWHDLGRFLGCYGNPTFKSPNLDQLAQEGVLFSQAFAVSPLCSPSRGALFTGRYPHANGITGLTHLSQDFRYKDGEKRLPEYLRSLGYHSTQIGLQHEDPDPSLLGFDEFRMHPNTKQQWCHEVADITCDFLNERSQKPDENFFASVGFFETHRVQKDYPSDRYPLESCSEPEECPSYLPTTQATIKDIQAFAASVHAADAAVGKILNSLKSKQLEKSTWVIFTTDHGIAFPRAKSTLYDAGLEAALLMRWPGVIQPNTIYEGLTSHLDFVPTILSALGAQVPDHLHGTSYWEQISTESGNSHRQHLFGSKDHHEIYDPIRMVRTESFKLIRNFEHRLHFELPSDVKSSPTCQAMAANEFRPQPRPEWEMYDLKKDPSEQSNLVENQNYLDIFESLKQMLKMEMRSVNDPLRWSQRNNLH